MKSVPYIVATAGHVDHGKSALVRALTGTDPDRLPEEKARGITIDLGFAALSLASPDNTTTYQIGIIDVPGHEDFVKNMVAGVGSIDMALMIVAADDGWMPQTEEHLQILSYLDVRHAVVALTKSDLASDLQFSVNAIRERLAGTRLADAPIVPTSVVSNTGIEDLKREMSNVLSKTPPPQDIGKPRLAVDRVFTLKGIGTVVTGTLTGGTLRRGQQVIVQPRARRTHIRSVQTHNREVEQGLPGSRVALNLPDLKPASGRSTPAADVVARGDVITLPELDNSSRALDVLLERTSRRFAPDTPMPRVKSGTIIQVHHGSGAFAARLNLLDRDQLNPGEKCIARLAPDHPIYAFAGDRFVIRDWPEQHTLAGGMVLDANPDSSPFRRAHRRTLLEARAAAPSDIQTFIASQIAHDGIGNRNLLLLKTRFKQSDLQKGINDLVGATAIVATGDIVADKSWWTGSRKRAVEAIDAHHKSHPEQPGLPLADLRQLIKNPMVADAMITDLCREGFTKAGTAIRRESHRPSLPPRLAGAGARIRATLSSKAFDPPSRRELAPDEISFQALKFLIASGEAVEISAEIILHSDAYNRALTAIRSHLQKHQAATVSELKTLLNSSRRIMVPLLERLDKDGITRRDGDRRTLRES